MVAQTKTKNKRINLPLYCLTSFEYGVSVVACEGICVCSWEDLFLCSLFAYSIIRKCSVSIHIHRFSGGFLQMSVTLGIVMRSLWEVRVGTYKKGAVDRNRKLQSEDMSPRETLCIDTFDLLILRNVNTLMWANTDLQDTLWRKFKNYSYLLQMRVACLRTTELITLSLYFECYQAKYFYIMILFCCLLSHLQDTFVLFCSSIGNELSSGIFSFHLPLPSLMSLVSL